LAIEPQLARHGGRIVKTLGDGLLLDFAMSPTLVGP
jgi:class 3 adenylate cyclase